MTIDITIQINAPITSVPFKHTVTLPDAANGQQVFAGTVAGLEKVLSDLHREFLPTAEEAEQAAQKEATNEQH